MVVASCFALLFACSSPTNVPEGIKNVDEMKPLVYDLMRADEYINNFVLRDTAKTRSKEQKRMYEQVFASYQISPADFYKSWSYYQQHPDINKILFDSLDAYANRLRNDQLAPKEVPKPIKP